MLELDVGPATVEQEYKEFNYRIYRLATPLRSGEQRTLHFVTRLEERGFPNARLLTRIIENGTFLDNSEISPAIGMSRDFLLKDRTKHRRNGLPADLCAPQLEDASASSFAYLRKDSDWVNAQISVTTNADQTPLAPGYTVSDEIKNGRRTLVTRTETPILHFFSIQSARFRVARDLWSGKDGRKVALAVYYHPEHDHNIQRILTAMKASLDVYSERFSPYPFHQARILEVPAYWKDARPLEETPRERVGDQPYIDHDEDSLVMYWLKEVVGEEAVDRALRLLGAHAFKVAPYPSTRGFLSLLQAEAPGHQQEISHLLERITLYDLEAREAVGSRARAHGSQERRADLTLVLDKPPRVVGIDPCNELIDRNSDDNLTGVKLE